MKKRFLSTLMATLSVACIALSGCGMKSSAPDYSSSGKQFNFYGYSSASNGEWTIDGVTYSAGEDFRTVERVREYKDAGMTIYFPQHQALYTGQEFETSDTKKALDMALEAGIDKVILNDQRIQRLSRKTGGIVGEGKDFATTEDLEATMASYIAPYKDHPAFYGLMLGDEPFYAMHEAYGQVYKALKKVCPDCFIQYNLNPITAGKDPAKIDDRFPKLEEGEGVGLDWKEIVALRYEKYLRLFLDSTGADYVQYDQYPLKSKDYIDEYYIYGLQMVAELAKEYDIDFYFVSQTYGQTDGNASPRMLSEADLYWLNNMLVGFGVKTISYFTYWTKSDNNTEHFIDGNSFITWYGEKTKIYDWMKQIMAEEQKLAPTILNFDYKTSKVYTTPPMVFPSGHAEWTLQTEDFTALKNVGVNKEVALVTELYDKEKSNYMYMVQNIVDPVNKGSKAYQTVELTFDSKYKYVAVFVKGERTLMKLDDGKLVLKHKAGEATYVLPY